MRRYPRLRTWLRAGSSLLGLLGIAATLSAVWLLPGEHRLQQTAVHLRESGISTVADSARVVQNGSGRNAQDALEATFRTRQQQVVTVRLLGSGTDWGIAQPPRPLTVFYDPAQPSQAMSADDLSYYLDEAVPAAVTTAGLGGFGALIGGAGCWVWRRPAR
ncbi:hypothetical protein AB2L27_00010 [Kineococcus sp. LSe6-4]|uniref:DUF3592 domain-containing protein n=1 Tax=Kineococcus halophytocola TaxID=3234027 RepID=A0ABV4GV18_9ACTN